MFRIWGCPGRGCRPDVSGETVEPMYKVEIQDGKEQIIKTYEQEKTYILGAQIDENMITLERAKKSGNIYTGISEDYITNNAEQKESNIVLESYFTDFKGTQMRLTYSDGISDKNPKLHEAKAGAGRTSGGDLF